ncbi:histidinol-phosphate transaminase [Paenibacillus oceani]|uniref:Histidinol-phosphate aminotransferase n=1 Tax=Paenibacillus oceani TaxID=2772510 RepID=A0A927H2A5_9BACL|nr:histidinol-phosphate transaminase [Paenibacillus oceani]MBD2864289.1 histidinol-phosphate transaminase [Paenibacillus oceani]
MIPIHPRIEKLQPYVAGSRPEEGVRALKLNQNENRHPLSPKVEAAIRTLSPEMLQEYPDARCDRLREALSSVHGVPVSSILCGNGSSELITLLFRTFLREGDTVAVPDPTFALYANVADIAGVHVRAVPTDANFHMEPLALAAAAPQAVILANPNAPTGVCVTADRIEKLLQTYNGLVVIDEAYIDFAPDGTSVLGLTERYDHLLVLRTFSKAYSLSGARVGFAAGNKRLIDAMLKGRETFSVNGFAQLVAEAAVTDQAHKNEMVGRILSTRERFAASLQAAGWTVWPSTTNFMLVSPPPGSLVAQKVYEGLLARHIYVRYFAAPRLDDKLRISVGTDEDMDLLLDALLRIERGGDAAMNR